MSYNNYNFIKVMTAAAIVAVCLATLVIKAQTNGITSDETGITIQAVPNVVYTIVHEIGSPTTIVTGDVMANKYDIKSIPGLHDGQLIRVDSVSFEIYSGLVTKQLYITLL